MVNYSGVVLTGGGVAAGGVVAALPPRILNITVPQVGHLPLMALRPFFMTSSTASTISFLALHLTQYPSGIKKLLIKAPHAPKQLIPIAYGSPITTVNWERN